MGGAGGDPPSCFGVEWSWRRTKCLHYSRLQSLVQLGDLGQVTPSPELRSLDLQDLRVLTRGRDGDRGGHLKSHANSRQNVSVPSNTSYPYLGVRRQLRTPTL